ncbi:MAG: nucleotidyltransferase domain-containing protein [Staphylococcus sp.]|nr:nucleotidyltransferase domain-containing protein [Staphylococcus sp.]
MTKSTLSDIIPKLRAYFSTQPVTRAWLFGSYSRGEESENSDVDILLEFDEKAHVSLFTMGNMYSSLTELLHRAVDIVEKDTLMNFAIASVEKDKILIYERNNP